MALNSYDDYDDFGLTNYKGGGGNKKKAPKDKKNPDGKYTSKHVRLAQDKKENSAKKRVNEVRTRDK